MKSLCDNFINGNLTDAKRQAKRYSAARITLAFYQDYGFSILKAAITADYLKGQATFQEACDAQ
jgi:hypothetical protein